MPQASDQGALGISVESSEITDSTIEPQDLSSDFVENMQQFAPTTTTDGSTAIAVADSEFVSPTLASASSPAVVGDTFDNSLGWTLGGSAAITGGKLETGTFADVAPVAKATLQSNLTDADFSVDFDFKVNSDGANNNDSVFFAFANHDDVRSGQGTGDAIICTHNNISGVITLRKKENAQTWTSGSASGAGLALTTQYYMRFTRVGTTVTMSAYTNSGRTTLHTSCTITVTSALNDLDRICIGSSESTPSNASSNMTIDNLTSVTIANKISAANVRDDKSNPTTNKHTTDSEVNPFIKVDMNTAQELLGVAIHFHSGTTVTSFKIETSAADVTYVRRKTVPYSLCTAGQWNIILFPRPPIASRYLKITGLDAGAKVLSVNEIAVLVLTESVINRRNRQIPYVPTDSCSTLTGN